MRFSSPSHGAGPYGKPRVGASQPTSRRAEPDLGAWHSKLLEAKPARGACRTEAGSAARPTWRRMTTWGPPIVGRFEGGPQIAETSTLLPTSCADIHTDQEGSQAIFSEKFGLRVEFV